MPADEWDAVSKRVQKMPGGPSAGFQVPRVLAAATPDELEALREEAGPLLPVMAALLGPAHRRRERLVFG